jgi:ABC-type uncharacterized transport system permease subunit
MYLKRAKEEKIDLMTAGRGWMAITIVVFGKWDPKITCDGKNIIMSDGTAILRFLDTRTSRL